MSAAVRLLLALALALVGHSACAHKPSDSYLTLQTDARSLTGHWDIALRDLEAVFELDRNHDGRIVWGEVRTRLDEIDAYALQRLSISREAAPCPWRATDHQIDRHSDGAYLVLGIAGECAGASELVVHYNLLFDIDAQHRGLLKLQQGSLSSSTAVFSADTREQRFDPAGAPVLEQLNSYLRDGLTHIALGYDHLLFLVALLLPAVLGRVRQGWLPATNLSAVLWRVASTVTAFTVAHSITLSVATLGLISLPTALTESMIALSVLLTAIDNLIPILPARRWVVAFSFGLIHGFGFATVLQDLALPKSALALSLFGFNAGVEIGQLMLVAIVVPLAYLARRTMLYQPLALRGGSLAIGLLSLGWLAERSLHLRLMPF